MTGWKEVVTATEILEQYLEDTPIKVVSLWGGVGKNRVSQLQSQILCGTDILVCTLGLFLRLINKGGDEELQGFDLLSHCYHLIFDDADEILEVNSEGVRTLLGEWFKSRSKAENGNFCQQVIVTAKSFTSRIAELAEFLDTKLHFSVR